jgi:flagellar biosynthesis protein FlhF
LKLKTYRAWTMAEALTFVKADLGADAVILHTRTFDRGGFLGFGKRTVVEITAGRAADMPREAESVAEGRADARRAAVPAGQVVRQSVASRAYGETRPAGRAAERPGEQTVAETPAAGAPVDQAADREKTRRLALAMSIQLEKQADVRDAAAQNERATLEAAAQRADAAAKSGSKPSAKAVAGGFASSSSSSAAAPATQPTQPTHPAPPSTAAAQRFVLVAHPVEIGNENGDGKSSGLERLASVVVPAEVRAEVPATVPARIADIESQAAAPSLAWPLGADAYGFDGGAPWPPPAPGVPLPDAPSTPTARETAGESVGESVGAAAARASSFAGSETVRARHTEPRAGAVRTALDELAEISDFVGRVLRDGTAAQSVEAPRAQGRMPREPRPAAASTVVPTAQQPLSALLEPHYARLIEQEVADELARRVLDSVAAELVDAIDAGATPSERVVREAIERRIAAILPSDDSDGLIGRLMMGGRLAGPALSAGAPRRVAFVGPTGVGKTTTLAKIAAQLKLKRGLRVGIVAADTYRIAAVEQLRTYAAILELPVEVASSPAEAAAACDRLAGQGIEIILIDTAGRSQNDRMKLSELRAFLAAAAPDETHLVLSATAGERTLAREAEAFGKVGVDKIVLTKLDEAASFGTLINLVERLGKRVSLFTNGQEVPDHIELGRGRRLAELVMGSEVR